jgi:hypothetical protein
LFSVASRSISAMISALTGGRAPAVGIGPLPGDQMPVPAQDDVGGDEPVQPQPSWQDPDQCGEEGAVGPSSQPQSRTKIR